MGFLLHFVDNIATERVTKLEKAELKKLTFEYIEQHPNKAETVIEFEKYLEMKMKTKLTDTNDEIKEIIEYFNAKTQSNYSDKNKSTVKHIKARLNEGYNLPDFITVIDKKYSEWINTDMAKYIRPETLFGTKFESYLNQKDAIVNKQQQYIDRWANI